MSAVKRVSVVAMALLAYALAACSPQAYQVNPNPDVAKKGEQVPESQQEGYMRIIGDLRWDELPNKEAWQKRFPGCFNDGGKGQGLYSKFTDGNYRPTGNMPSACQIEVGGFRLAPLGVSTSIGKPWKTQ